MSASKKPKTADKQSRKQRPGQTDIWEGTRRYGTYNIQPTADTSQEYPAIAQGSADKNAHQKGSASS